MKALNRISLYFSEGRSDKENHAELVEVYGGHVVNFHYGHRGGALNSGTKTEISVDFDEAKAINDKLVKEKNRQRLHTCRS